MYSISPIQKIIKPLAHGVFQRFADKHQADRHSKGFRCYDLLTAMVYAQITHMPSLRTLESSFNHQHRHHYHLHTRTIHRSTLAEALAKRSCAPFEDAVKLLMQQCSRQLRRRCGDLLYLLDSTPVQLKGRGFDEWVSRNGRISGIKMHVLMDAQSGCPLQHSFSAANVNDVDQGKTVTLQAGATYVFDKAYCDYNWWHDIDSAGAFFVTRLKRNAAVDTVEARPSEGDIEADEIIVLRHRQNRGKGRQNVYCGKPLRRITVKREGKEPLVLVTNCLDKAAADIAAQYKQRWQIELLFKWLKQHMHIKKFYGRVENAVKLQLLCALISYLLLRLYHHLCGNGQNLWLFMAKVAVSLFEREETHYGYYSRRRRRGVSDLEKQGVLF